jgi:hypothetical protein
MLETTSVLLQMAGLEYKPTELLEVNVLRCIVSKALFASTVACVIITWVAFFCLIPSAHTHLG